MSLYTLRNVQLAYGAAPLFDGIDLQIEPGERLCLVGRNGTGKSTLMKLLNGDIQADSGEIIRQQGLKVARLVQEVPRELHGSIYDVVAGGLGEIGDLLAQYHHISHGLASGDMDAGLQQLEKVQHKLEALDGWSLGQQVDKILSRMQLDAEQAFEALSGGLKRRVLLARELVKEPELLLLDEPTNHLDVEAIQWLEEFLLGWKGSLLFITHDRMFLRRLATRIIELDRGRLTSWPGNYDTYLERKEQSLEVEAQHNALFDKRLAQEETWIRQGIKARRTRNEGRVRALKAMREERSQRRERSGKVKMQLQGSELSGKVVIEAENISYQYEGRPLFENFSTVIMRGDKIGILGPNGVGKSTLLNVLLGRLQAQQGKVKLGTKLEVAFFDQMRSALNEEASVIDNVAEGSDKVDINGQSRHVISYLQDFLFSPERARQPVRSLSGGERNRLLLAKLFTRPANLLVMDEPTNDLDVETLELLEEILLDYSGTLLLVSHDRAFINNVVTSTIVFEGEGRVNEYVGGYDDWQRQYQSQAQVKPAELQEAATTDGKEIKPAKGKGNKLSYKDQRELDALPDRIEMLEQQVEELHKQMASPDFFQQGSEQVVQSQQRLQELEQDLSHCYKRWEVLDA